MKKWSTIITSLILSLSLTAATGNPNNPILLASSMDDYNIQEDFSSFEVINNNDQAEIIISIPVSEQNFAVTVYDVFGMTVNSFNNVESGDLVVTGLISGAYFVEVANDNSIFSGQFEIK